MMMRYINGADSNVYDIGPSRNLFKIYFEQNFFKVAIQAKLQIK
jgi:hypothetical protein